MPVLWIVHRDPAARRTLARLAGVRGDVVSAAPGDPALETARDPDVVLLGPSGDFEAELELAHRFSPRLPGTSWILLPEPGAVEDARRLFDALPAEVLPFPPERVALRRRIRAAAAGRRRNDSLSERHVRDALADRFRRWFSDLDLPELLRAVDPHLAGVPVLVRGEPGTGRTVIAQYIHVFGGSSAGTFVHVPCRGLEGGAPEVLSLIRESLGNGGRPITVCLEDVESLAPVAQRQIRIWIENGLPPGTVRTERVRWIATTCAEEPWGEGTGLDPTLEDALAGVVIRIPPLRERMEALDAMVEAAAASWCQRHGQRTRAFTPDALAALREVLWLGNVREVEAAVARTLAANPGDPVDVGDLVLDEAGLVEMPPEPAAEPARAAAPRPEAPVARPEPAVEAEPEPAPRPAGGRAASPEEEEESAIHLRELVGSIAHEIRNPLVAVRTFAQLLPERYQDPEFRRRAADIVGADVRRIEHVVDRLARFAELAEPETKAVDVAGLLETVLEGHREIIQRRRLVVLTELDRSAPHALGDPEQLRFALEALLGKCLELVPERGDLYFASKHHADGLEGRPCLRVLVRFRSPGELDGRGEVPGVAVAEAALEMVVSRSIVRAHGGRMTVSSGDARETVVVIDLPAPAGPSGG